MPSNSGSLYVPAKPAPRNASNRNGAMSDVICCRCGYRLNDASALYTVVCVRCNHYMCKKCMNRWEKWEVGRVRWRLSENGKERKMARKGTRWGWFQGVFTSFWFLVFFQGGLQLLLLRPQRKEKRENQKMRFDLEGRVLKQRKRTGR